MIHFDQMTRYAGRLRQGIEKFQAAQGGNVVILFALALVPIFGAVGAALDYTRANSVRTAMRSALDAASLNLVKDAGGLTADQITATATQLFNAQFNRPDALNREVIAQYDASTAILTLNGSADVKTTILPLLRINQIHVGAMAKAQGLGTSACVFALDTSAANA